MQDEGAHAKRHKLLKGNHKVMLVLDTRCCMLASDFENASDNSCFILTGVRVNENRLKRLWRESKMSVFGVRRFEGLEF